MDSELDKGIQEQKKKTRRTRKDEVGRNFSCPCGKSYLSYPALYTHIKTKHQGKAPTIGGSASQNENLQQSGSNDPLIQIKQIVNQYFPNPLNCGSTKKEQIEIPENITQMIQNFQISREGKIFESNSKNQNICSIFARFLCEMKSKVRSQGFAYLCQFISMFTQSLAEQRKDKDYCINNNGMHLPHYFNELIVKKRVPYVEEEKFDEESQGNYLTLGCKILYHFGIWIFQQKYTNYSLKYNTV